MPYNISVIFSAFPLPATIFPASSCYLSGDACAALENPGCARKPALSSTWLCSSPSRAPPGASHSANVKKYPHPRHPITRRLGGPHLSYGDHLSNTAIRGVYPEYGLIRNEIPSEGRWISPEDLLERRRVVFLGGMLRRQLFSGRPAVGETVLIQGVRFTVIGTLRQRAGFLLHRASV